MTTTDTLPRRTRKTIPHHRRLTLAVMCLAAFIIQLDVTIVNIALPRIQSGLGLAAGTLLWVVSAYALSLAAFVPVAGALGDRFGHRPVFLVGVGVFVAGSAACALARDGVELVVARAIQGAGGASMLALTLSIIATAFPARSRARAISTWAAVGGTGFGVGPVAGGLLLSTAGWSVVFWVNVPVGLLVLAGATVTVPRSRRSEHPLDRLGAVLCAVGLVAVTYGLSRSGGHPWTAPSVAGPLLLGLVALGCFAGWERRAAHPMAPPALVRMPGFAAAATVYLMAYAAFGGILYFATLFCQDVAGWSVLRTGLSWLFMNIPFLGMAQFGGAVRERFGARTLVAGGCLLAGFGAALLTLASTPGPWAVVAVAFVLSGAGFGAFVPVLTHVAMGAVPPPLTGIASGLLNTARQVGTAVGLALLGYVAADRTLAAWRRHTSPGTAGQGADVVAGRVSSVGRTLGPAYHQAAVTSFEQGFHWAVGVGAGLLAAGALVAWRTFPRRDGGARG
ncbi:MFS transporter [Flexivirga oryzae]|uniref:EmrB/QacA subfamily drug resistance transporter n=1 Tax=Flexivirga oryzae TaxID=1794944 RepID=A0A839N3H6_9MICO|nr:MFS transporter [Flexivirga oryzae]MBB2890513.1 EmrB/QacA subfamily drug resistance transporter [Flexivirga oryzae]